MPAFPIYQVDAFTEQLFGGNPAAIVPLKEWLPSSTMQQIAFENNLSETAFFVPEEAGYHLRWFTPATEVDLCGHATLAAAHVLFQHLRPEGEIISFFTKSGELKVKKWDNSYEMDLPSDSLQKVEIPSQIREALKVEVREAWTGREDYLVLVDNQETIENLRPDFSVLKQLENNRGVIVTSEGRQHDFVSRCFFPNAGINEDPVTGSAHTTLAPYWAGRLKKKQLTARQLSSRGGSILCRVENARTFLIGNAVTYMIGEIYVH